MLSVTFKSASAFLRSPGVGSPCSRASLMLFRISKGSEAVLAAVAVCGPAAPAGEACTAAPDA
eukprot:4793021-Alexandrium_andersonii.AAC.1